MGNNPVQRLKEAPTLEQADRLLDSYVANSLTKLDANDVLYALESSGDYDPGPGLEKIHARLFAVNFADDLINPPELGVLEREIKRVKRGKAILIPLSEQTRGHGTHTLAPVWKKHLAKLLKQSETRTSRARGERADGERLRAPRQFRFLHPPTFQKSDVHNICRTFHHRSMHVHTSD